MTFAFVFPGQGSQTVGMLKGFESDRAVRDTVAEASDLLNIDFKRLINEGPSEDLSLTTNTQPVMLSAGVAFFRAWQAAGGRMPSVMAGHSLGEYAALVAAQALPFAPAVPLVRFRAEAMQRAVPVGVGGMAAVLGLSPEQVQQACLSAQQGQVVEAVNFNDPAQTVIAGHLEAVERACVLVKEMGAKRALMLAVSAPFHSSLMAPAAKELRDYLSDVTLTTATVDVINNVDVAVEHDPSLIREALVKQASSAVRWIETIEKMASRGVTHVVECGPGKVLGGMVKRINRDLVVLSINDEASLHATLEAIQ